MDNANPEQQLIDVIVDQIGDDEALIEGLGSGTLSLRDVERWRARRWESERWFMQETGRIIARMRDEGFGSEIRRGGDRTNRPSHERPDLARRERASSEPVIEPDAARFRFSLDLGDLGLSCSLRLQGEYDEVLDAGVFHLRRAHHVHGDEKSLRDTVESAIVERQSTSQAPETRYRGLRTEEMVSDEWANRARGSGLSGRE